MSQQNLEQEAEAKQEAPPPPADQESVAITNQLLQQPNPAEQQQRAALNAKIGQQQLNIDHQQQFNQQQFNRQQFKIDQQQQHQQYKIDHQQQYKIDGLIRKLHDLETTNAQLRDDIEKWRRASQARDTEFTQIRQEKAQLESELTSMESRFGAAANIRWSDNDANSAYSLRKDLEKLDGILSNYTNLKRGVEIKHDNFKPLLQKYKCRIKEGDVNDILLQAALQRLIFDEVFAQADEYFQKTATSQSTSNSTLECEITEMTRLLVTQLQTFVAGRLGTDKFSSIAPIRIRQISNAVLGTRGFASTSHPLVTDIVSKLNQTLSHYRNFTDAKKKATIDAKANDLVGRILNMFYFKLNTQEPPLQKQFYDSGNELDSELMEWSGVDEMDDVDHEVQICYFPAVGCKVDDIEGKEDKGVYYPAKVLVRKKESSEPEVKK